MATDNADIASKLDLRRFMVRKHFGEGSIRVFDACQGEGAIWAVLKRELNVVRYWGVDIKPEKGRLKIDSVKVIAQGLYDYDVIDIDTYGSPWRHWLALLPTVKRPLIAFLTIGSATGIRTTDKAMLNALGLGDVGIPSKVLQGRLSALGVRYCLADAYNYGLDLADAAEAPASRNARYLAAYLRPHRKDERNENDEESESDLGDVGAGAPHGDV